MDIFVVYHFLLKWCDCFSVMMNCIIRKLPCRLNILLCVLKNGIKSDNWALSPAAAFKMLILLVYVVVPIR